jgi:preprotein translocase SecE subunit
MCTVIEAPRGVLTEAKYMNFIKGLGTEFNKITWLKPSEAFAHASLVIGIAIVVGYYLGLLDAAFAYGLKALIG